MKLILIHGRAQHGKDPVNLKDIWIGALREGLSKSRLKLPIESKDIIFPYYGDKLDVLVRDIDKQVQDIITRGNEIGVDKVRFFYDFLTEIAENADVTDDQVQRQFPDLVVERGPLNWPWVLALLKAIEKSRLLGDLSISKFTYDVFVYLTTPAIKQEINKIVLDSIPPEPCVVVGHSLGSVIGYNVLRDNSQLVIQEYITLGSPLGVSAVKRRLKVPIMMPESVKNGWYNAFDQHDVVSLRPLDQAYFNVNPAIFNNDGVRNHTSNHHGIEGYLDDKAIAKQIYGALKEVR